MTKKFYHSFLTLLFILPLTFAITSCSDDDDDAQSNNESIIGSWFYETKASALIIYAQFNDKEFYFEIYTSDDAPTEIYGTYSHSNNTFKVINSHTINSNDDFDEFKPGETYTLTRKDNHLTIRIDGINYTLERDNTDYDYL